MFVALLAGGYLLLQSGRISANADGKLSRLELWMAHTSLRATLRHQAPEGPDPLPLTNANLIAGIPFMEGRRNLRATASRMTRRGIPSGRLNMAFG